MKTRIKHFFREIRNTIRKKSLKVEKRYRFAISTIILTVCLLFSTFFPFQYGLVFIPIFFVFSYVLVYFSIIEDIEDIEWFGLFLMPVLVTLAFYFFYFLFPARWLTRLPFTFLYGISIYAMLLCSNIFNVGKEKSLQLYRAAFSVNFFYHAIVSFFIFNFLFSLQQVFILNAVVSGVVGFILGFHLFWTIRLNIHLEQELLRFALLLTVIVMEVSTVISFLPLKVPIYALFLTASYYSLSGLIYHYLDQRLFKETIREYVIVLGFVGMITFLSLTW